MTRRPAPPGWSQETFEGITDALAEVLLAAVRRDRALEKRKSPPGEVTEEQNSQVKSINCGERENASYPTRTAI